MTQNTFDIFSWNVRGINGYIKRRKIFDWMIKHSSVNSIFMFKKLIVHQLMKKTGVSSGDSNCFSVTEQVTIRVF